MKLQTLFHNLHEYSCLALDYIYAVVDKITGDASKADALIASILVDAVNNKMGVDEECYVFDPVTLMNFTAAVLGKKIKCNVSKIEIQSYKDLPFDKYCCVQHKYQERSHFVLAKNNTRIYDSLDFSSCINNGVPISARVIDIKVLGEENN